MTFHFFLQELEMKRSEELQSKEERLEKETDELKAWLSEHRPRLYSCNVNFEILLTSTVLMNHLVACFH